MDNLKMARAALKKRELELQRKKRRDNFDAMPEKVKKILRMFGADPYIDKAESIERRAI